MATSYRTPGVYVEEVSSGARPIDAVGTSTAGFVGSAPRADQHVNEPKAIQNWSEFRREFVDDDQGRPVGPSTPLTHAVAGFFANGGRRCYVVNVGRVTGPVPGVPGSLEGVDALELIDEVAIVAAPGWSDPVSHDRLLTHCEQRKDRVAILDGPEEFPSIVSLTEVGTAAPTGRARSAASSSAGAEDGDAEPPPPTAAPATGFRPRLSESGFGAFYVPWVQVADPLDPDAGIVSCPPSGHVAGVWAMTDSLRGVHKAPGNVSLRGVVNLTRRITASEQEELNPAGVNCIRFFPGQGTLVWGVRTVAESSSEWKYINVRRLFSMVEESIIRSTRWIVFEPNGESLWKSVERDITAFLTRLWRTGALQGTTREEAFFVQCNAETNPPDVRDAGQVVTLVGIAPLKPAEFVVFKMSQHQSGTTSEGGRA